MVLHVERRAAVTVVTLDRPEVRNAVDTEHAEALHAAFEAFDRDPQAHVAVLTGAGGTFCSGADLHAVSAGTMRAEPPDVPGPAPMGPTRLQLDKPVIAAIEGHAVAGGLELALWCDLRVADPDAVLGVFSRRWGVPLIDGGTVRLPRLVGRSRALDLILTGRPVTATEAMQIGLVNRVSAPGKALEEALELAAQLAGFPQVGLRNDRLAVYETDGAETLEVALRREWRRGADSLEQAVRGASHFSGGAGRHGGFTVDSTASDGEPGDPVTGPE
jgi:enoyl-CoA hydratase